MGNKKGKNEKNTQDESIELLNKQSTELENLISELMKLDDGYTYSVSAKTRSPRSGEKNGVNYFFLTREQFEEKIANGGMLEYAEYVGNYYGTPREFVKQRLAEGKNVILEIETCGAMQVKRLMPEAVMIFLCPPDAATLEARLRGRGTEDEETILRRLDKAKREIALASDYDYLVINRDGKAAEAAGTVQSVVAAERCRRMKDRIADIFFAQNK